MQCCHPSATLARKEFRAREFARLPKNCGRGVYHWRCAPFQHQVRPMSALVSSLNLWPVWRRKWYGLNRYCLEFQKPLLSSGPNQPKAWLWVSPPCGLYPCGLSSIISALTRPSAQATNALPRALKCRLGLGRCGRGVPSERAQKGG